MVIEELSDMYKSAWDEFVHFLPQATFFHLTGWKNLVEKVWRYKPVYLMARTGNEIRGILPLFLVRNLFFGKRLISVPFAVSGGVCTLSKDVEEALVRRAAQLTEEWNLDYLELRQIQEVSGNLETDTRYVTFHLELNQGPDLIWKNLRKSLRRCIKKAMNNDLQVDFESRDIKTFYRFYSEDQRNFGTPVQGFRWIKLLFNDFPENHAIARVRHGSRTVAMFLVRRFKETVSEVLGNDLPEFRHMYPNHILEWRLLEDACKRGYTRYDFGRSLRESGPYFFKMGWGADPVQMHYQYYMNKRKKMPDHSQVNPSRKRLASVWKRFPVPLANALGPVIRKRFP
jgi:FemAB-related protein (PEP-CTERM system-associated)